MMTVTRVIGSTPTGQCDRCRLDAEYRRGLPRLARQVSVLRLDESRSVDARNAYMRTVTRSVGLIVAARSEDDLIRRLRSLAVPVTNDEEREAVREALVAIAVTIGLKIR